MSAGGWSSSSSAPSAGCSKCSPMTFWRGRTSRKRKQGRGERTEGQPRAALLRCALGRRVRLAAVNLLDAFQYLVGEAHVDAAQVAIELIHVGRADDVAGHEGLPGDEGQRHLGRVHAVISGQLDVAG